MYKPTEGMLSYVLHRVTGVGVLIFLAAHIIDTALIGWGPEVYNKFVAIYAHPAARFGEVVLAAALLFHALNGIRIILIDFWPNGVRYEKAMFYIGGTAYVVVFVPMVYYMLAPLFQ